MRIGGGIGGGDAARRLPSFSAAPTLSSPRSVINLASEILNLAPPAYRFFLFQVTLSNLPCTAKFAKVRILNLVICQAMFSYHDCTKFSTKFSTVSR